MPSRKWTFIIVPPEPGAPTRRVAISDRPLRVGLGLAIAAFLVAMLWSGANANNVVVNADRLADAERMILVLHDSVHSLHAQVMHDLALVDSAPEMILPVSGEVTSEFSRSRLHPLLGIFREHDGVDLAAPTGTPIVAPALATVTYVGWRLGDGLTVQLAHNGGVTTLFAHCSRIFVQVGQRVHAGQTIAAVGSTGLATASHLHFEVSMHGVPFDPLKYLTLQRDSATVLAERTHPAEHQPTEEPAASVDQPRR